MRSSPLVLTYLGIFLTRPWNSLCRPPLFHHRQVSRSSYFAMSASANRNIYQADQVSDNFRSALMRCNDDPSQKILSPELVRGLLMPPKRSEDKSCDEHDACPSTLGLPRRPYYRELAHRIVCVSSGVDPLLPAEDLGMSELPSTTRISVPSQPDVTFTEKSCFNWLKEAGNQGTLRLLGMRNTIGTEEGLLPPDWDELLAASRLPHKDLAPPHDSLTVAGRARCKHAHRGSQDDFFSDVTGGTREKNEAAERLLVEILKGAAWINIHKSTGIDETVLEVRVASGYGARWTADWSLDPANPTAVTFRGFLEPNQVDGHEKRWRH